MFETHFLIHSQKECAHLIEMAGFLPFFANGIPGFSLQEHVDPTLWFTTETGPWEWKGPLIRDTHCAYGKFFANKAVFISKQWMMDFANYRRDGYDYDARYNDGLSAHRDRECYELIEKYGPLLSKRLKKLGDYRKGGKKGFDTIITRLQSQGYVTISDFVYETKEDGTRYGWGVAEYATLEQWYGAEYIRSMYQRTSEQSYQRMMKHLKTILPQAEKKQLEQILK